MKRALELAAIVGVLALVGLFAGQTMAVVAEEGAEEAGVHKAAAGVESGKAEHGKEKAEAVKRVDPRATMVADALKAIDAAKKALEEGNKEAAAAELDKAKTALAALQKSMERPVKRPEKKPDEEKPVEKEPVHSKKHVE